MEEGERMLKQLFVLTLLFGCVAAYGIIDKYYDAWQYTNFTRGYGVYASDVDGDGTTEVLVTGSSYNGSAYFSFLNISSWNGTTMVDESHSRWRISDGDTYGYSTYAKDVDADGAVEILITGHVRDIPQDHIFLNISAWNGTNLVSEGYSTAYNGGVDSAGQAVFAADVDDDGTVEIVIAGYTNTTGYLNISRWSGAALTTEYSGAVGVGRTNVFSAYAGDVDNDSKTEILTTGWYSSDGISYNKFLSVQRWNGTSMAQEYYGTVGVSSMGLGVHAADVDDDGAVEILTTGDGAFYNGGAFINITRWNGSDMTVENYSLWADFDRSWSVFAADVDNDGKKDILTVGDCAFCTYIQVSSWNGSELTDKAEIYWSNVTRADSQSVYAADIDNDGINEILDTGEIEIDENNNHHAFLKVSNIGVRAVGVPFWIYLKLPNGTNIASFDLIPAVRSVNVQNYTDFLNPALVATITVNFTNSDINFTGLVAANDTANHKALLHMPSWPSVVAANKSLYVPGTGKGWVRICPEATSLTEVNETCTNGYTQYAAANWNGSHYNITVTGSGGIELTDIPPTVSLNAPAPGATSTSLTIQFNFTPADDWGFSNCSLWLNSTGSWAYNASNQSAITNNTVNTITKVFAENGDYTWNVECCDNASQCSFNDTNRTLTVNFVLPDNPPTVALNAPAPLATSTSLTVDFEFTPADDSGFSNCSLWTDETGIFGLDTANQTGITNNTVNTITKTFALNDVYTWNVQCCDNSSQCSFDAANRTLIISVPGVANHVGIAMAPEDILTIAAIVAGAIIVEAVLVLSSGRRAKRPAKRRR
jgi:hypothetical protein